jgi:hypothetical protein
MSFFTELKIVDVSRYLLFTFKARPKRPNEYISYIAATPIHIVLIIRWTTMPWSRSYDSLIYIYNARNEIG